MGRETLHRNPSLAGGFAAGALAVKWDGRGASGQRAAPGIYELRVATPGGTASRRIVEIQ
jgi:hypothetical protein